MHIVQIQGDEKSITSMELDNDKIDDFQSFHEGQKRDPEYQEWLNKEEGWIELWVFFIDTKTVVLLCIAQLAFPFILRFNCARHI